MKSNKIHTSINEFKKTLINEENNYIVKFKSFPDYGEEELSTLDDELLYDEKTGIRFNLNLPYEKAWVDVKNGLYKDWSFSIYTNSEQIMIHGNPNETQGEYFKILNGSKQQAQKIANDLFTYGKFKM